MYTELKTRPLNSRKWVCDIITCVGKKKYRKDSQISRTLSLATQILEKKFFMKKNSKEIQSRDHEVFCLHPRQTRQQWIEKYFKVLPVILAL